MEYFDIRNLDGTPTGEKKTREQVHTDGDLHGTVHVWIARQNPESGQVEILLQKRSMKKDIFPGAFDISSAGHVDSGEDFPEAAKRELEEELGLHAEDEDLEFMFTLREFAEGDFHGKHVKNHEFAYVYLYMKPVEIDGLKLQEDEVDGVRWIALETLSRQVHLKNPSYCVLVNEVEKLNISVPKLLTERKDAIDVSLTETWAEDAQLDLEEWIEEQGIYLRQ